ncbi:MAG: primosome assembly protein PriA, partial [Nocardioides sp.]
MTDDASPDQQPELLPGLVRATVKQSQAQARAAKARKAAEAAVSDVDPVARVLVDLNLAHLDRPFDYAVPAAMADSAVPGARVKVRFAGKDVDGFVVERAAASDHVGRLTPLRRVVSAEPVLSAAVATLTSEVAQRYAGVRSDVLRLAVPPRHATVEKEPSLPEPPLATTLSADACEAGWAPYPPGGAFLRHVHRGAAPRAVWGALPGEDWPTRLAEAAATALLAGRGTIVCVPDARDVARLDAALEALLGPDHHVVLTADAGPARRYRAFLAVARGARRIVVGTRAAAFAPVAKLGLVAIWDDGDDLFAEPRAPYPHTREVLLLRAAREQAAVLVGGHARSVEADQLVRTGWAHEIDAPREEIRRRVSTAVTGSTEHDLRRDPHAAAARIPRQVYEAIRDAVTSGPVLVQTPRAGYALALACDRCRTPATCTACHGPLALSAPTSP